MQIAMILSDLKSLSVCGHEEALNLVNVHRSPLTATKDAPGNSGSLESVAAYDEKTKKQPDLQRAKDLVELHYLVKLKYLHEGLDADLRKARDDVKGVYTNLSSKKST